MLEIRPSDSLSIPSLATRPNSATAADLATEQAARIAAVAAEAAARATGDADEATARTAAIADEATLRSAADTDESTARTAADTALDARVDEAESALDGFTTAFPLISAFRRYTGAKEWPGYTQKLFSEDITGKAEDREPLGIGTVRSDDDFGFCLEIAGTEIPDSPGYVNIAIGDCPLEPTAKYQVHWLLKRSDDPSDPVGDAVELRIECLDKNGDHLDSVTFGEISGGTLVEGGAAFDPRVGDDPIDVSIVVSRIPDFDVEFVVPTGTRSIVPHVRLYDTTGATRVGVIAFRPHTSIPEFLGDVGAALAEIEATAADLAIDAAAAEAAAAAAAASLASFTVVKRVDLADALEVQTLPRDVDDPEIHGKPYFPRRGSLVFGGVGTDGDNLLPNQSVIEIKYLNLTGIGSGLPITIAEWNPDGNACEPVVFRRSRGSEIGITGDGLGAVQAGDSLGSFQFQADDGLGTANVAAVNLLARVQSGTTPIPGDIKGYAGNFLVALAAGDSSSIRTVMEWQSDGDVNLVVKNFLMNNTAVFNQSRQSKWNSRLSDPRAAVADDAIYTLAIPGGATALVKMIPSALGATTPFVIFACRTDSAACEKMAVSSSADGAGNVLFTTASGAVTDFSLYTDAKLTIVASNNGNVYIVNRLGASKTYGYHIDINSSTL